MYFNFSPPLSSTLSGDCCPVSKNAGDKLINASFTVDRSAVDGSRYETFNAGLLFPVGNRLDLEVDIGRGRSDLVDSGTYVGVMLWIYGG